MRLAELLELADWPQCPDRDYNMHGWLNEENKIELAKLIKGLPENPLIVEVGTWLGMSAEYMLELRGDVNLITIDHFKGSKEEYYKTKHKELIKAGLYKQAVRNLYPYKDRCYIYKSASPQALYNIYSKGIKPDLIYIDGSHYYTDVASDIGMATKLFPKAIVCGDDARWGDVHQALWECTARNGYVLRTVENFWRIER
jgi:predicted O-methyltransferase YrrM